MAKILLCVHQFFPRFYTGTESLTLSVAEELKKRNHTVEIFTVEPYLPGDDIPGFIEAGWKEVENRSHPVLRKDNYEGIPVWRLYAADPPDPLERLETESKQKLRIKLYENLICEVQPDLIYVFHLMRITGTFIEVVKNHRIPVYFAATDFWLLCPTYQLIQQDGQLCTGPDMIECFKCMVMISQRKLGQRSLKFRLAKYFPRLAAFVNPGAKTSQNILNSRILRHKRLMKLFDGVIWSNSFLRDMFHQNGLTCKNEKIIPFPVPQKAKDLFTLPAPSSNNILRVAYIGTLQPTKGPQILISALKKIDKELPIRVSIFGPEVYPNFLEQLKSMANADERITFRGPFPQESFPDVLSETDVVVIPSLWYENTPLTALSVLAARRVLVASNLGGLATLVEDHKNGFLFSAGDTGALADILIDLARNRDLIPRIVANIPPPPRVEHYVNEILKTYPGRIRV